MNTFMTLDLPSGGSAEICELRGKHLFNAINEAGSKQGDMMRHLIVQTTKIDGKQLTIEQLDEMPLNDTSYLVTILGTQINSSIF